MTVVLPALTVEGFRQQSRLCLSLIGADDGNTSQHRFLLWRRMRMSWPLPMSMDLPVPDKTQVLTSQGRVPAPSKNQTNRPFAAIIFSLVHTCKWCNCSKIRCQVSDHAAWMRQIIPPLIKRLTFWINGLTKGWPLWCCLPHYIFTTNNKLLALSTYPLHFINLQLATQ
jgi:hypothetical protein